MDKTQKLIDTLKNLNPKETIQVFPVQVVSVEENSCTVSFSEIEQDEVRLKASLNDISEGLRVLPKVDSTVLVLKIGNDIENLLVIAVDEIDQIRIKIDDSSITYNSNEFSALLGDGKLELKNNESSLKDCLNAVLDAIKNLTVSTPVGVSGTPLPPTIQAISEIESDINKLFKG